MKQYRVLHAMFRSMVVIDVWLLNFQQYNKNQAKLLLPIHSLYFPYVKSKKGTVPVYILDLVPREFGFKPTVSQSYYSEALLGVALQDLSKIIWHCKTQWDKDEHCRFNLGKQKNFKKNN